MADQDQKSSEGYQVQEPELGSGTKTKSKTDSTSKGGGNRKKNRKQIKIEELDELEQEQKALKSQLEAENENRQEHQITNNDNSETELESKTEALSLTKENNVKETSTCKKSKNNRDRHFVNRSTRSMYSMDKFEERHDLEQYFWTQKTIDGILSAIRLTFDYDPEEECCCLCTPSLAHTWWVGEDSKEVSLLDIDTRFKYLPKFHYFDLCDPKATDLSSDSFSSSLRLIIFDPPFFYIPMQVLYEAVLYICDNRIKSTKILIGFLKREEKILLETFKDFDLKRTNFPLEYAHVKSNKWVNYAMYSNVDLPGIKRLQTSK